MTTSQQGLLEHGQRRRIRQDRRTVYETTGWRKQRTAPPRAADAAVNSAGAVVPSEELRAGRIRLGRTPRQAGDPTTRPFGSWLTRQSDARDFEPSFYTPIDRQGSGQEANDLY